MYSFQTLDIRGFQQEPVPHTLFQQHAPARHAALVLPGRAYGCQAPALAYPSYELLARGADILWVEYDRRPQFASSSPQEVLRASIADAEAACRVLVARRAYEQITIIGKSLGTVVMGYLLDTLLSSVQVRTIWLTPLLSRPEVRMHMQQARPALFVVGTADPTYDPALMSEVQAANPCQLLVIDGANHSLQIEDNVLQSLQIMEQLVRAVQTFLGEKS